MGCRPGPLAPASFHRGSCNALNRSVSIARWLAAAVRARRTRRTKISGGAKTAWFKDSEGNIMAIVESY